MPDIKIVYLHKTENTEVHDWYTFHQTVDNWGSDPAIIEEKIFCEDLCSGINYCQTADRVVPHLVHIFDSLYVRKVLGYSKNKYIVKGIQEFDDPLLQTADVFVIQADVLVFLTDKEVDQLLSTKAKVIIDASFEAFTFQYYYPIFKLFTDRYQPQQQITMVIGADKFNNNDNLENAFKDYTGIDIKYFNYFRVNEVLVGSEGINEQSNEDTIVNNHMTEDKIIEHFNSTKSKKYLCLNNRPRFHRMALIEKLRELDLLDDGFVSRRWQWPAKKHIVQPILRELLDENEHSPRLHQELAIYGETAESMIAKLKAYPEQMIIDEFDEDPNIYVPIGKDNTPDLVNDRVFSTEVYKKSIYSLVVETYYEHSFIDNYPQVLLDIDYEPSRAFLTEKVFKPIQYGHMFIPFGMKGTARCLDRLGFKNFHEEFNCNFDYDRRENDKERYEIFINIIKNFDGSRINDKTLEKILHNYRLFYNKQNIMEGIDKLYTDIL